MQDSFSNANDLMNDAKDEGNPGKNVGDFQIEIDPKLGDPLEDGLNMLSKVFGGLVQTIKDAVGPEFMRGMELDNWLEQLATCLEQIARSLRETGEVPAERAGELAFFVDQWDNQFQHRASTTKSADPRVDSSCPRGIKLSDSKFIRICGTQPGVGVLSGDYELFGFVAVAISDGVFEEF